MVFQLHGFILVGVIIFGFLSRYESEIGLLDA